MKRMFYSLKNRVTAAFLLSSLITFVLVSSASYYTIYSILYNKIEKNIQTTLDQVVKDTDRAMDNLLSVSSQLSYRGTVSNDLANYLSTDSYASKRAYMDIITSYLNLIDFTNPNAGFHFYSSEANGDLLFANGSLDRKLDLQSLPLLTNKSLFALYGPHPSFRAGDASGFVLSVSRPVDVQGEDPLRLYLETNVQTLSRILDTPQLGMPISYVFVSERGRVVFSELPDDFPQGSAYSGKKRAIEGAYLFDSTSRYGWKLAAAFDKSVFNSEIRDWALRVAVLGIGLMLAALLLGYLVWRAVYSPIKVFKREIGHMASSNFDSSAERTNVAEFDQVLRQFELMKGHIQTLLLEVRQNEIDKRQLEVDKLLSQINPHFLYNTLNTVQWIARAEGQERIVKLVSELTRLLRYNLGKEGSIVTVEREIAALKDYVSLQLVRNDYQFQVRFEVDDAAREVPIPRFILQPLVENAIYHGLVEGEGTIRVRIEAAGDGSITVSVADDGAGLSEEQRLRLLEGGDGRGETGLGIGLRYVNKMLEVHYGGRSSLSIDGGPEGGTVYRFAIPADKETLP